MNEYLPYPPLTLKNPDCLFGSATAVPMRGPWATCEQFLEENPKSRRRIRALIKAFNSLHVSQRAFVISATDGVRAGLIKEYVGPAAAKAVKAGERLSLVAVQSDRFGIGFKVARVTPWGGEIAIRSCASIPLSRLFLTAGHEPRTHLESVVESDFVGSRALISNTVTSMVGFVNGCMSAFRLGSPKDCPVLARVPIFEKLILDESLRKDINALLMLAPLTICSAKPSQDSEEKTAEAAESDLYFKAISAFGSGNGSGIVSMLSMMENAVFDACNPPSGQGGTKINGRFEASAYKSFPTFGMF